LKITLLEAAKQARKVMRELVDLYSCEWCETRQDHDAPKKPRHKANCAFGNLDAAIRAGERNKI
jgi:hypothetical protein